MRVQRWTVALRHDTRQSDGTCQARHALLRPRERSAFPHTPSNHAPRPTEHPSAARTHRLPLPPTMPVPTSWHPGEIAAQQARGYEDDVWGMWENYETGAPSFMLAFLNALPFLSVTSLDHEARPWTSLLSNDGRPGFLVPVQGAQGSRLQCTIRAPAGVPIRECLLRLRAALARGEGPYDEAGDARPAFQIAAVGVMLHNRRRNKMEGVVVSVGADGPGDRLVFQLDVTSTFGNCPKCASALGQTAATGVLRPLPPPQTSTLACSSLPTTASVRR